MKVDLEVWKFIKGFPKYEVSNLGNIRSYKRLSWTDGRKPKTLSPRFVGDGRLSVALRKNGRYFNKYVHRLVLETFVGPCPDGLECNHKDGNPINNRLENLEWITHGENLSYDFQIGTRSHAGEPHPRTTLKEKDIKEIRKLASQNIYHKEIGIKFGVTRGCITGIVNRRTWKHVEE